MSTHAGRFRWYGSAQHVRLKGGHATRQTTHRAVTLVEVLVVAGIASMLVWLALPGVTGARVQARAVACRSNLHQLALSNLFYAQDHAGTFVPGASEFIRPAESTSKGTGNLNRWHGWRPKSNQPFDPSRGPLAPYIGADGGVRQCPAFIVTELVAGKSGFERGCGGYGYNNRYVGRRTVEREDGPQIVTDDRAGAALHTIKRPAETIMFADAAFVTTGLTEYSFAEPRFHPESPANRADPSIHFRHGDRASVAWCDGHVDEHKRTFTWSSGLYSADPAPLHVGWFGTSDDNGWFDLK